MHPFVHAAATPDKPAVIMAGSGAVMTYAELEARSNRMAHLLRSHGLQRGDTIAILMTNCADYLAICWGAQRSGLVYVAMSTKLTADEAGYIIQDSGAKLLVAAASLGAVAAAAAPDVAARYAVSGRLPVLRISMPRWRRNRRRASPMKAAAATCCIQAVRPVAPRVCAGRCRKARSMRGTR